MGFRLKADESVARGVRRVVREQLDKALDHLTGLSGAGADEVVHDARKRLKRVRAVLRLVRPALGRKAQAREDARFRDAGRPLARVRDARVLVETFDRLVGPRDGDPALPAPEAVAAIRRALAEDERATRRRVLDREKTVLRVTADVQEARRRVKRWDLDGGGWRALGRGLRRIYRDGARAFREAGEAPTDEGLHEWRKRVKDLAYALRVLEPVRPGFARGRGELASRLADVLGEDHDLAVLRGLLSDPSRREVDRDAARALRARIDRRRAELRRDALGLGRHVYADRPRAFVGILGACWRAWRAGVEADGPGEGLANRPGGRP